MRELIQKKSVQILLGILLIAIWGYNMMSFFNMTISEESIRSPKQLAELDLEDISGSVSGDNEYNGNFRDPFAPAIQGGPAAPDSQPETGKQPEPVSFPELQLTGIVERTAIIQNMRQEVVFAEKGDTVGGAKVNVVTEDSVVLTFQSKQFTLKFNYR